MSACSFQDEEALAQLAINQVYDGTYQFYRKETQRRADDQIIRAKAGQLLGAARKCLDTAERDYRRKFLPPPSRDKPRPDPEAVAHAQEIERLARSLHALQTQLGALLMPDKDSKDRHYQLPAPALEKLAATDKRLIGQAELLRSLLDQKDGTAVVAEMPTLEEGLRAIGETLRLRQLILFPG